MTRYAKIGRRSLLAAVPAMALLAGIASAQGASEAEWQEIVAKAREEGALTVYANYDPNQIPKIVEAFQAAYPEIKVEVLRLGSAAVQQRIDAEAASGTFIADVIGSADIAYQKAHISDGRFAKLVGPDIHSDAVGDWLMGEDTFAINYFVAYGYGWNSQMIEGTPSLKDLMANPEYKGRVGLVDFARQTTFAVSLEGVARSYELTYGDTDFYQKLGALEPKYYTSVVPIIQAIAAGELVFSPTIAPGFVAPNLPVGNAFLEKPPAGANYVAVIGGAPNPNAAQVYANWCLTVEGQTVLAENQASVLPGISTARLSAADLVFSDTSALDQAEMDALVARQVEAIRQ
jgi:iron(III) transport system substrate-binding protein